MRVEDYLDLHGIEVANSNRSSDYLNAGLLAGVTVSSASCECAATDAGPYLSPAEDPAPWYDSTRPESAEFLGLLATEMRLDPVGVRSVSPRLSGGATIGRLYLRHRVISLRGIMLANSMQGMSYGERWLADVVAGRITGCAQDTARILLACPSGDGTAQFRTLRKIGIVDGPTYGQLQELPECYLQEVQIQVASGVPWLLHDPIDCLSGGYS